MSAWADAVLNVDEAMQLLKQALLKHQVPQPTPTPMGFAYAVLAVPEQERTRRKAKHLLDAISALEMWRLE